MRDRGVITPVKGAYNLSARGKERVKIALDFLERYPILIGDLAINRIALLKTALVYLTDHRTHSFKEEKTRIMDQLRKKFRDIKERGIVDISYDLQSSDPESLGYFFAGVIDGEGSFGTKSSDGTTLRDCHDTESLRDFWSWKRRLRKMSFS